MSPLMIPLAIFAMIVLIVGFAHFAEIRNLESEVQHKLHALEIVHEGKMQDLNQELQRLRDAS